MFERRKSMCRLIYPFEARWLLYKPPALKFDKFSLFFFPYLYLFRGNVLLENKDRERKKHNDIILVLTKSVVDIFRVSFLIYDDLVYLSHCVKRKLT